ncbi:hypothetical protein HUG10_19220 (plasmid) [Halorarum halophilum]|uniref:Uncharacterized protein n=1 Tax=Halorarum halophilum TaxID=2743090 RepID=A0A7D5KYB7_9EURY|nr:hypothetical protein [Halobaculum halophilum]QLG29738.1 hypothetical protein HUG10_19220 [Halobaculum halophilum]
MTRRKRLALAGIALVLLFLVARRRSGTEPADDGEEEEGETEVDVTV